MNLVMLSEVVDEDERLAVSHGSARLNIEPKHLTFHLDGKSRQSAIVSIMRGPRSTSDSHHLGNLDQ